jgi:hypothetical protein
MTTQLTVWQLLQTVVIYVSELTISILFLYDWFDSKTSQPTTDACIRDSRHDATNNNVQHLFQVSQRHQSIKATDSFQTVIPNLSLCQPPQVVSLIHYPSSTMNE